MNEVSIFEHERFGQVRTVETDGKVYFCGKDVATALGYADYGKAIRLHCKKDDRAKCPIIDNMGRSQQMTFIDEGNLYRLITHSKLETAQQFESWVFDEVLPALRKTGSYKIIRDEQKDQELALDQIRIQKAKLFFGAAKMCRNETFKSILLSYMTKELADEFVLPLPKVEKHTYSATEIGARLGISANMVGRIAIDKKLKTPQYGEWQQDKAKHCDKTVETFRYYENVLEPLREILGSEK